VLRCVGGDDGLTIPRSGSETLCGVKNFSPIPGFLVEKRKCRVQMNLNAAFDYACTSRSFFEAKCSAVFLTASSLRSPAGLESYSISICLSV